MLIAKFNLIAWVTIQLLSHKEYNNRFLSLCLNYYVFLNIFSLCLGVFVAELLTSFFLLRIKAKDSN